MKRSISLKVQVVLGLLLGLVIGYFFSFPMPELAVPAIATFTPTVYPQPFVTLDGAWMVRVNLHRLTAPDIIKITRLSEGRLTVMLPGENKLQILDARGSILYQQTFQVEYVAGDPPQVVDSVVQIFVIPVIQGAKTLQILTPNGEARHEFPAP